jgi:hypothetical protein
VSPDPVAAPKLFIDAPLATRAARDGAGAMTAKFKDGTRADYEVWQSPAQAARFRGQAAGAHADVRSNVVIVYSAATPHGRAAAATVTCVPK